MLTLSQEFCSLAAYQATADYQDFVSDLSFAVQHILGSDIATFSQARDGKHQGGRPGGDDDGVRGQRAEKFLGAFCVQTDVHAALFTFLYQIDDGGGQVAFSRWEGSQTEVAS